MRAYSSCHSHSYSYPSTSVENSGRSLSSSYLSANNTYTTSRTRHSLSRSSTDSSQLTGVSQVRLLNSITACEKQRHA